MVKIKKTNNKFQQNTIAFLKNNYHYILLALMIIIYMTFFSIMSIDRHEKFQSLAFDLGIYDHAIWRFSQFKSGFNYVRGIHIFGDHFTPINVLVAPLYWFFSDVRALLVLQTIALASAAVPVFLIAQKYLKNRWQSLLVSFALLMFPAIHYINLEDFHPESFIVPLLLWAFYFLFEKKMNLYLLLVFLTLACKEEIALTIFMVGCYIFFRYSKKYGIITILGSFLWFITVIFLIAPFFNGYSYLYGGHVFGQFGNNAAEIAANIVNPSKLFPVIFTPENGKFMLDLFGPVGFLSVLSPIFLLLSVSLWLNLISSWPYAHNIYYHYVAAIIPFVFLSLIRGLAWLKKLNQKIFYAALAVLFISTLLCNYYVDHYDASLRNAEHIGNKFADFGKFSQTQNELYYLISIIPDNASVSATYNLVPHLTHRERIYDFPNPFEAHYWGTWKEQPELEYVDYIFLSKGNYEDNCDVWNAVNLNNSYYLLAETTDKMCLLFKKK
jgi:uncharacterized membrane protein